MKVMQLMTLKEAQEYLRKSKSAFYRDMQKGIIPVVHIGAKPLVVKDELDKRIKQQLRDA